MEDRIASGAEACSRDAFVQLLTAEQRRLYGYIATLIGDVNDASNVLQQTNMVLWRNAADFKEGTDFHAWAIKTAYFQTLAFLRDRRRDRLVFDESLVQSIADCTSADEDFEELLALRECFNRLPESDAELIRQRYWPGKRIEELARQQRKSQSAVKMALMRVRQALAHCIERKLRAAHE